MSKSKDFRKLHKLLKEQTELAKRISDGLQMIHHIMSEYQIKSAEDILSITEKCDSVDDVYKAAKTINISTDCLIAEVTKEELDTTIQQIVMGGGGLVCYFNEGENYYISYTPIENFSSDYFI